MCYSFIFGEYRFNTSINCYLVVISTLCQTMKRFYELQQLILVKKQFRKRNICSNFQSKNILFQYKRL